MKVLMDETDLRRFADACVEAQREVATEMATADPSAVGYKGFDGAPGVYKWGRVVERALGKAFD